MSITLNLIAIQQRTTHVFSEATSRTSKMNIRNIDTAEQRSMQNSTKEKNYTSMISPYVPRYKHAGRHTAPACRNRPWRPALPLESTARKKSPGRRSKRACGLPPSGSPALQTWAPRSHLYRSRPSFPAGSCHARIGGALALGLPRGFRKPGNAEGRGKPYINQILAHTIQHQTNGCKTKRANIMATTCVLNIFGRAAREKVCVCEGPRGGRGTYVTSD